MTTERTLVDPVILADVEGRLRTARALLEMTAELMSDHGIKYAVETKQLAEQTKTIQFNVIE